MTLFQLWQRVPASNNMGPDLRHVLTLHLSVDVRKEQDGVASVRFLLVPAMEGLEIIIRIRVCI